MTSLWGLQVKIRGRLKLKLIMTSQNATYMNPYLRILLVSSHGGSRSRWVIDQSWIGVRWIQPLHIWSHDFADPRFLHRRRFCFLDLRFELDLMEFVEIRSRLLRMAPLSHYRTKNGWILGATVKQSFISDSIMWFHGLKVAIAMYLESETLILNWYC